MKTVIKGFKYRIYPNKEQEILINKTFGCCRFVYNQMLAKKIELYKENKKSMNKIDCNNYCNRELKIQYPFLKEVDKFALTNSIYHLDNAYNNFFRRVKQGKDKAGFPKFKSKHNHYYSYTTNCCQPSKTVTRPSIEIDYENNLVKLPKLKWIKCKLHREFQGKILFATISKVPSGKYYVSFNVECEHKELQQNNNTIGIDLGIKDLLITSNGETYSNQKLTYKYERKLAKLQRQLCKKKIGSNNYKKQTKKIAKLHEKISNTRLNNLHQISLRIISDNQVIISEDLNVKGMVKNHNLAKAIYDMGWYELTRQLEYKSEWNDKTYHKVNRFYASSQLCNVCGYKNTKTKDLGVREWVCPKCGTKHNRDKNAAINILNEGLRELKLYK